MYNVAYDTSVGVKHYCARNMPLVEAKRQLANFTARYLNADGTPRAYPNGKGVYDVRNPRVVRV
jgi:hypothetical protein